MAEQTRLSKEQIKAALSLLGLVTVIVLVASILLFDTGNSGNYPQPNQPPASSDANTRRDARIENLEWRVDDLEGQIDDLEGQIDDLEREWQIGIWRK